MLAIFLDIETTGLNPLYHRVLEIAFKIVDLGTGNEVESYHSIVKQPLSIWEKRDPVSTEINGFTYEKMEGGKDESLIKNEIIHCFEKLKIQRGKAVYICQNPAFDRSFFNQLVDILEQEKYLWPYHWLDLASMYWALKVQTHQKLNLPFPTTLNLSKNSIAIEYGLPMESTPHTAINGVNHLIACYKKVLGS